MSMKRTCPISSPISFFVSAAIQEGSKLRELHNLLLL
jgi:hypothetical protein